MKPILACDADLTKVRYPIWCLPKIDGVRALCPDGKLVGRSGKPHKNKLNTAFYSDERFRGFDGEMVVSRIRGDGICAETNSALTTINGEVRTRWCLFDFVLDDDHAKQPYAGRYTDLLIRIANLHEAFPDLRGYLWVIPYEIANNEQELLELEDKYISLGYEGMILRDPDGVYKYGRATAKEANYLRCKPFMDTEMQVTHVIEGQSNQNELKHTPNGYAERSTHAENMVPNGMVGSLVGIALEDVTFGGRVVIRKGQEVECAAGKMTHDERRDYFENPHKIIGQIVKYQFFPIGIKDKPRFPTFQTLRSPEDLG